MSPSNRQKVLKIAQKKGVICAKDLAKQGIHRQSLKRLEEQSLLIRSGRGIYTYPQADITENHSLVEATQRVPKGTICLLSALSFHKLTTQNPFEIWLAIPQKSRHPQEKLLPLRIVYMSGSSLIEGVENHQIEGCNVQIYSLPKTVVDCFKFRHKIGLDVALEALRECWQQQRCSMDELWHYAKVCRMRNVMRPYLESLA